MAKPTPLTDDQQRRIERLRKLATVLDSRFTVPGLNFQIGWDGIIGLIPGVGDLLSTAMSLYIISEAQKLGVSRWTTLRMVANVAIDALVGAFPVLGDFFDIAFKANLRNLRLMGIEPLSKSPGQSSTAADPHGRGHSAR